MVCLDSSGAVVRNALLWNDTRSSGAALELIDDLGGAGAWAEEIGVVPVASITATKLRWLADNEPDNADRTAAVLTADPTPIVVEQYREASALTLGQTAP